MQFNAKPSDCYVKQWATIYSTTLPHTIIGYIYMASVVLSRLLTRIRPTQFLLCLFHHSSQNLCPSESSSRDVFLTVIFRMAEGYCIEVCSQMTTIGIYNTAIHSCIIRFFFPIVLDDTLNVLVLILVPSVDTRCNPLRCLYLKDMLNSQRVFLCHSRH